MQKSFLYRNSSIYGILKPFWSTPNCWGRTYVAGMARWKLCIWPGICCHLCVFWVWRQKLRLNLGLKKQQTCSIVVVELKPLFSAARLWYIYTSIFWRSQKSQTQLYKWLVWLNAHIWHQQAVVNTSIFCSSRCKDTVKCMVLAATCWLVSQTLAKNALQCTCDWLWCGCRKWCLRRS